MRARNASIFAREALLFVALAVAQARLPVGLRQRLKGRVHAPDQVVRGRARLRACEVHVREAVRRLVADEHGPVERRNRARHGARLAAPAALRRHLARVVQRLALQHRLEQHVGDEHEACRQRRQPRAAPHEGGGEAGEDDAAEPQVDDERRAPGVARVRERREHDRAEAGDQVAGDVRAERERAHAVQRPPAPGLPQDLGQKPRKQQRPERQQQHRVRRAAVLLEVQERRDEAEDEVEVRRGAGEEARGDAARGGARRGVLRRRGAREQRARQGVSQRVQMRKMGTVPI